MSAPAAPSTHAASAAPGDGRTGENENAHTAMLFHWRVIVTIKSDVLDPAGLAVAQSLPTQAGVAMATVRLGRVIDITIQACDRHQARRQIEAWCQDTLHNPVVEEYDIQFLASLPLQD